MGKKLGFEVKKEIPEKIARILGVKPKQPLVDKDGRNVMTLIKVTKMIEDNNYQNICGALQELKKGNDEEGLRFIAANTNSIDVCMAIINGDFSEGIKDIAEKKLSRIGDEFASINSICREIKRLEEMLKNGYLSVDESAELLELNAALSNEISELGIRELYDLAADSKSLHVCRVIVNGSYPEDVRRTAENRMEQLKEI